MLREACREAAGWPNAAVHRGQRLGRADPRSGLRAASSTRSCSETGLDPARLELEITETALIRDPDRALITLRQLKALGVRIAMDDFGTGYSSLSNLRAFPFDKIKIDGSFIRSVDSNAQAAAIVRSVLGLGARPRPAGHRRGRRDPGGTRFLAAENCHAAQGYFIGRPGPIAGFRRYTHGARTALPNAAA